MDDDSNQKIRKMIDPMIGVCQIEIDKSILEIISDLKDRVKKLEERVDWIVDQSIF